MGKKNKKSAGQYNENGALVENKCLELLPEDYQEAWAALDRGVSDTAARHILTRVIVDFLKSGVICSEDSVFLLLLLHHHLREAEHDAHVLQQINDLLEKADEHLRQTVEDTAVATVFDEAVAVFRRGKKKR